MDADHLDIYGDASEIEKSFKDFSKKIKPNGKLFVKNGLPLPGITYGIEDDSDYTIQNIKIENGAYRFDVKTPRSIIENITFNLPGRHNLSNALVALAMALEYGCSEQQLVQGMASTRLMLKTSNALIKTKCYQKFMKAKLKLF